MSSTPTPRAPNYATAGSLLEAPTELYFPRFVSAMRSNATMDAQLPRELQECHGADDA